MARAQATGNSAGLAVSCAVCTVFLRFCTVLYGGYGYFTICLRLFYGYFTVILRLFYGYFTVGYGYFTAGLRLFYDLSTVILRLEYGEMASWEVPETEKPAQFKSDNPAPPGSKPILTFGGGCLSAACLLFRFNSSRWGYHALI